MNPLAQLAKYGPMGIVLGVFLAFFTWGGKVVIERLLHHLDLVEVVLKEQTAAQGGTARAMETMAKEVTVSREMIEKLPEKLRRK